jgi:hypothetical protein
MVVHCLKLLGPTTTRFLDAKPVMQTDSLRQSGAGSMMPNCDNASVLQDDNA